MRLRNRTLLTAAVLLIATNAFAKDAGTKDFSYTESYSKEYALDISGSFWIDNTLGNIEVVGVDAPGMMVTFRKTTTGIDKAALQEGRDQTQVYTEGDSRLRSVRTVLPMLRNPRWISAIDYTIRVPRTVHVKIVSHSSDHIHVANISGNVTVKNVNGTIRLDDVSGATIVESINGNVIVEYAGRPVANALLSSINGQIQVYMSPEASVEWLANTIKGDYLTNLPVRGLFNGSVFRGNLNSSGGPTISTTSLMNGSFLLRRGTKPADAHSVIQIMTSDRTAPPRPVPLISRTIQQPIIEGNWTFSTNVGNVQVGQVRGDARVDTGAGEVELDTVTGSCTVTSLGGPLNLGEISGWLIARTRAGDVLVRGARSGGIISTGGGIVQLFYTAGPTNIHSDGGDIIVRQAAGPVSADTHSGDITITVDASARTQKIEAKAYQGNVIFNAGPRFAADVDATVLTSDPDSDSIHSDFHGLTIRKDQANGKTRIRATGKINGGGERVELYSEDGDIHISSRTQVPISVTSPQ
ncbi:MAG TPA: DUF4097 family beta strand repeat-containing protein [Thermoanaerobaculia bacterium]|nr:DUF4097 family beta strand repeat-containing protein [Thermoanaerobaculia bacterium]